MTASLNENLERRKQVRLRSRPNLQSVCRLQGNRRVFVVKNPVSQQYYHLEEAQKFALDRMDGSHTLFQIQQEYERERGPQRLSLDALEGFASQLLQFGLVENEVSAPGQLLLKRKEKERRLRQWAKIANLFYFKVPLLASTGWLDKLIPLGRILFHPLLVLTALVFLFGSAGLIVTHWNAFLDRLPGYRDLFTFQGIVYLWLAMGLVKIVHELGHAICARTLGSEVYDLGVVFMFFFPTLYCNVSDSWMLPQKWKRIAIAAAGIYVELLCAGGAAWIWWASAPGTLIQQLSFWTMLTCSVHTIVFNANPLMRFDGYFIFSDWLDIPNLSQAARRRFTDRLQSWLGFAMPAGAQDGPSKFLFLFGLASFVYRLFVVGSMIYLFHGIMMEFRLEWVGLTLILLLVIAMLALPVYQLCQFLSQLREVSHMKRWRLWICLTLAASLFALFFLVAFPMNVSGLGLIQIESGQQSLQAPAGGGFLVQTFARDGQSVKQGDVLAVFRNPRLDTELRLSEADRALRIEQLQALLAQQAISGDRVGAWDSDAQIRQDLQTLEQQHAVLVARAADLTVRAPCDGVLMGFPGWESLGKWLEEGTPICQIGDPRQLRVLILLEPADRQLVDTGKAMRFRCHGVGETTWHGEVTSAAQVDARDIPVQLAFRVGGEVASKLDPVSKTEKPDKQHYLVSAKLSAEDSCLQVGTLGQVRIDVGSQTGWWRLRRYLGATFQWRI